MQFTLDPKMTFAKLKLQNQKSASLGRKAKIFASKLPQDFFQHKPPAFSENKSDHTLRDQIHTQKISRKTPGIQRQSSTKNLNVRQGGSTSRIQYSPSAFDLLLTIISSTKQVKEELKRHSSLLKRQSNIVTNLQACLSLPPLKLKKVSSDS